MSTLAVLDHVAELLESLGQTVKVGDATGAVVPYRVVWSNVGLPHADGSLACAGPRAFMLYVTATAATARGAMMMAEATRTLLTPGDLPRRLTISGAMPLVVDLSPFDSRPVDIDRSVTLTGSNTHPAYAVEIFDVSWQPI